MVNEEVKGEKEEGGKEQKENGFVQGALCFNKEGVGMFRGNMLISAALRCRLKWKGGFEGIIGQTAPFSLQS